MRTFIAPNCVSFDEIIFFNRNSERYHNRVSCEITVRSIIQADFGYPFVVSIVTYGMVLDIFTSFWILKIRLYMASVIRDSHYNWAVSFAQSLIDLSIKSQLNTQIVEITGPRKVGSITKILRSVQSRTFGLSLFHVWWVTEDNLTTVTRRCYDKRDWYHHKSHCNDNREAQNASVTKIRIKTRHAYMPTGMLGWTRYLRWKPIQRIKS